MRNQKNRQVIQSSYFEGTILVTNNAAKGSGMESNMTLQQINYAVTIADCNSMNKAAAKLFISQPSLSGTIKDLEDEIGITIFNRTNRGITVTPEGNEFLGYARQLLDQYRLLDERYIEKKQGKKRFSVSMQHYTFAVKAFVKMVQQFGMDEYEFSIYETKTHEVMQNVRDYVSEVGILFINDFNEKIMQKLFLDYNIEFTELFSCKAYVYLWKGNPLAQKEVLTLEDLEEYPCLAFDQGEKNSFYLSEEVLSTYAYKRLIRVNDRATMLNLMVGLNGYTMCSGIICEELNGTEYAAIPLEVEESMRIGYVKRKGVSLSMIASLYIEELRNLSR